MKIIWFHMKSDPFVFLLSNTEFHYSTVIIIFIVLWESKLYRQFGRSCTECKCLFIMLKSKPSMFLNCFLIWLLIAATNNFCLLNWKLNKSSTRVINMVEISLDFWNKLSIFSFIYLLLFFHWFVNYNLN